MISRDHRLVAPWDFRYASHDHAVVFQFLDSEETPMTMESSDTMMPIYRIPGRLDMVDTAKAGTDVSSRT